MGLFHKKQQESADVTSALYQELRQLRTEVHDLHGEVQQNHRTLLKADALDGLGQKLDRRLAQVQTATQTQRPPGDFDQLLDRFRSDVEKRLDALSQALLTLRESRSLSGGPSVADLMRQIETRESERSETLRQELAGLRTWLGEQLPRSEKESPSTNGARTQELDSRFERLFEQVARTVQSTDSIHRSVQVIHDRLEGDGSTPERLTQIEERLSSQLETLGELKRAFEEPASDGTVLEKLVALEVQQRRIAESLAELRAGRANREDPLRQDLSSLRQQWSELQSAITRGEAFDALGVRLEKLLEDERSAHLEEVVAARAGIDALRSRLDEQFAELKRLDAPLKDLKHQSDLSAESAERHAHQTREAIDALHQSVHQLPSVDLSPLESKLTDIRSEIERAGKSRLKEAMSLQTEHEKTRAALETAREALERRIAALASSSQTLEETAKRARSEERERFASSLLPLADVLEEVVRSAGRLATDFETTRRRGLFRRADPANAERRRRVTSWSDGVGLVRTRLEKILSDLGVTPIVVAGRAFDPSRHVAVGSARVEGKHDGEIVEERLRGYQLGDRVLRYAEVVVGKSGDVKTDSQSRTAAEPRGGELHE